MAFKVPFPLLAIFVLLKFVQLGISFHCLHREPFLDARSSRSNGWKSATHSRLRRATRLLYINYLARHEQQTVIFALLVEAIFRLMYSGVFFLF